MTKQEIIDLLYSEIGNPDYKTVGDYHKGIADKLLTLIEQEKKEQAIEIINKFDNKLTEKCLKSAEEQEYQQTARILKDVCPVKSHRVAKELAKEYEVEL